MVTSLNTPRREFSTHTKCFAWKRSEGRCEGWIADIGRCDAPLLHKRHHYDHIDPDWFSKDNELENCQVLCEICHAHKTKLDIKNIAKSKRIIKKRAGIKKKSKFKGWRKFDRTIVYAKR